MRKELRLMFLLAMVILLMSQVVNAAAGSDITQKDIAEGLSFCKDYPVSLQVNGNAVQPDVPPVIIKERTLIPARVVFETMGAVVNWDEASRVVEVSLGSSNVKLTIDSNIALVNGEPVSMNVPAMIINSRTLIPVRFVAESLNCGIGWDDLSRTVKVTSPTASGTTTPVIDNTTSPAIDNTNSIAAVNSITLEEKSDKYRITIQGDSIIKGYKTFAYDSPDRFGVDLKASKLKMGDSSINDSNDIIKAIRYSQFEPESVRIVIDLKQKVAGKVSFSTDKNCIYIDFDKEQAHQYQSLGTVTADGLPVVDWRATEKLVVIDPGHGGKDTGSQGKQNGAVVLNEKDVNLDVALRLNQMLKAAGVSTYILRETDTTITLQERPTLANAANGDLYIAVHNNSSVNPSASGVETYYNSKANESDYGIYSKHLAEVALEELTKSIGIKSRGAKSEPAYAVLNKTQMPAIIIEGAFLSNTDNLNLMMTDDFRQNYAKATAKAIIQILNESVKE